MADTRLGHAVAIRKITTAEHAEGDRAFQVSTATLYRFLCTALEAWFKVTPKAAEMYSELTEPVTQLLTAL